MSTAEAMQRLRPGSLLTATRPLLPGDGWVRYDDPETKTFKLNVERQNGRAAMMGMLGCFVHELLGVDALYPTGGLGGAAPPPVF
jgi:hypothetical protein